MLTRLGLHTGLGQSFRLSVKNGFPSAETAGFAIRQRSVTSLARGVHTSQAGRQAKPSHSILLFVAGTASIFAYSLNTKPLLCQPANQSARPYAEPHTVSVQGPGSAKLTRGNDLPPVESAVDLKSLSFGAVAGISTGIFVKKGLKAVGFLLGGAFVFLQYLSARGMTTVDWKSMASRYDSVVDGVAGAGLGSRFKRLSSRILDFLMADFPPRATFAAGLALGLRIG